MTEKSADRIRRDRSILRVEDFARAEGLSVRSLQRLFAAYVGVGPKWVFLRYRVHERAHSHPCVDWSALAAEPGYSDQAHLVRDFTATVGIPPTPTRGERPRRTSAAQRERRNPRRGEGLRPAAGLSTALASRAGIGSTGAPWLDEAVAG